MSVKITISYQTPEELWKVIKQLQPLGINLKVAKRTEKQFKKAYITLK